RGQLRPRRTVGKQRGRRPRTPVKGGVTRGEKANGLGLAIVGKLGKKIGATMGVQSQIGAGSLFWLNIPIERKQ
ncbi:MAG: hypothetical protein AAF212_10530, partial [Verrucomicrobiota bacterium]